MHVLKGRPSPWMVLAVCALVFAVVGTALAGTDGLTAKITKPKVKSISKKQADKELKANVAGSHVNAADTATNATNATNATTATNATNATTAANVNGQTVSRVFAKIPINSTQTVATFDVFTLTATCDATGDVEDLLLDPSTTDTDLGAQGNGNAGEFFTHNQGTEPNSISLDSDATNDNDRGTTTFSAARTGGLVLSGIIGYDDTNSFNAEAMCAVYGHVTQGG